MSALLAILAPVAPLPASSDFDVGGELLRVVLSLAGIVVLILLAGWSSRRLQARGRPNGRRIRCLETMALSARERVLLLEVDGQRLIVGTGAGGLRTLHVLTGEAPVEAAPSLGVAAPPSFADLLGRWKSKS